jgi:hypothetical protein
MASVGEPSKTDILEFFEIPKRQMDTFVEEVIAIVTSAEEKKEIWQKYVELQKNSGAMCVEHLKEQTAKKTTNNEDKIQKMFKTLKESLGYEESSIRCKEVYEEMVKCDINDNERLHKLVNVCVQMENSNNANNLQLTYLMGKLFVEMKRNKKSVIKLIVFYKLNVSRAYVQEKIGLHLLMHDYPRLQNCKVSPNFLKKIKTLFESEIRYREDYNFWKGKYIAFFFISYHHYSYHHIHYFRL